MALVGQTKKPIYFTMYVDRLDASSSKSLNDLQALAQFGENYELISLVLPGRDRQSCKNKFKAEDKKNPNRITHCLKNRIPYGTFLLSWLHKQSLTRLRCQIYKHFLD